MNDTDETNENNGIELKKILEFIANHCIEKVYKKPRNWLVYTGMAASLLVGVTIGYFIIPTKGIQEKNKEIAQITAVSEKRGQMIADLTQKVQDLSDSEPEKTKRLRADLSNYKETHPRDLQEFQSLERTLRETQDLLIALDEKYKSYKTDHPEELTVAARNSLENQIKAAQRRADETERTLKLYRVTHPENITEEAYEQLKKQITNIQTEFSNYKSNHPYTYEDMADLRNQMDKLRGNLSALRARVSFGELDWLGRIYFYHTDYRSGVMYFHIAYEIGEKPADLKTLGTLIPKAIFDKYGLLSNLGCYGYGNYVQGQFLWEYSEDKNKYEYTLVLLNADNSRANTFSIEQDKLFAAMKKILMDHDR